MAGKDNLTPFTSDNAKEMQRKGAEKRKENITENAVKKHDWPKNIMHNTTAKSGK